MTTAPTGEATSGFRPTISPSGFPRGEGWGAPGQALAQQPDYSRTPPGQPISFAETAQTARVGTRAACDHRQTAPLSGS
jgi:hypothetical protein